MKVRTIVVAAAVVALVAAASADEKQKTVGGVPCTAISEVRVYTNGALVLAPGGIRAQGMSISKADSPIDHIYVLGDFWVDGVHRWTGVEEAWNDDDVAVDSPQLSMTSTATEHGTHQFWHNSEYWYVETSETIAY